MAAAVDSIGNEMGGRAPLKVAVVLNRSDDAGVSCLSPKADGTVEIARPGSAAKGKCFGPFCCVKDAGAGLFDDPTFSVDRDIEEALRSGTNFGLLSFGGIGQGKTTSMWGSPALSEFGTGSSFFFSSHLFFLFFLFLR